VLSIFSDRIALYAVRVKVCADHQFEIRLKRYRSAASDLSWLTCRSDSLRDCSAHAQQAANYFSSWSCRSRSSSSSVTSSVKQVLCSLLQVQRTLLLYCSDARTLRSYFRIFVEKPSKLCRTFVTSLCRDLRSSLVTWMLSDVVKCSLSAVRDNVL